MQRERSQPCAGLPVHLLNWLPHLGHSGPGHPRYHMGRTTRVLGRGQRIAPAFGDSMDNMDANLHASTNIIHSLGMLRYAPVQCGPSRAA